MLSPSIVPKEPSNPLLRLFGNYNKLRKGKPRVAFTSWSLRDSSYITNHSASQGVFAVSKSNANNTEGSWRNQMQKGSNLVKE